MIHLDYNHSKRQREKRGGGARGVAWIYHSLRYIYNIYIYIRRRVRARPFESVVSGIDLWVIFEQVFRQVVDGVIRASLAYFDQALRQSWHHMLEEKIPEWE